MKINLTRRHMLQSAMIGGLGMAIAPAWAQQMSLPPWVGYPGAVLQIPLGVTMGEGEASLRPQAFWGKRQAVVTALQGIWIAWVALPLQAALGSESLTVRYPKAGRTEIAFTVAEKAYPEQHLTITNKRQVNPNPDDLKRIKDERKITAELYKLWNDQAPPLPFQAPFAANLKIITSSKFGLQRFFNGEPRAPHSGLDFAAPMNMPVGAVGEGEVVHTGNFFFNGQSVFVHHGQGVISFYCHLNEILVREGDIVQGQQPIGKVGKTGRATGPHLHLGIYFSGVSVDPEPLLRA